jgi:hypothetical protein
LNCSRSVTVFQSRRQLSGNGRFHRTLHFSTNSANGGLQSTPAIRPRNRDGRVWVDSGLSRGLDDVLVPRRFEPFAF